MPRKGSVALVRKQPADEWSEFVPLWLHGRPDSTRSVYEPVIENFKQFVKSKPISQVTLKDLQDYSDQFGKQKARTVRRKLATIKSLLTFSQKTGMIAFNVGAAVRMPPVLEDLTEKILTVEEILRMIDKEPVPRNQALLRVLYGAGVRAAEASGLDWQDVQPRDTAGQIVVTGKGSKVRVVGISAGTWQALQLMRPADASPSTPVFLTATNKRMSRHHVTIMVKKAARRAGLEAKVSAHWMRHANATHSLDRGAPLPVIQKTLGHADLNTTGRYLHVRPGESTSRYLDI